MAINKKPNDVIVFVSENGSIKRTVLTSDVQIGAAGSESELQISGNLALSTKSVTIQPGSIYKAGKSSTILDVSIGGGLGSVTIVLPTSPRDGTIYYIKDSLGKCSTNSIIIKGSSNTVLIDGSYSKVISADYGTVAFVWSAGKWLTLSVDAAVGAIGPTGPQGAIGPTGAVGAVGPVGPVGATGPQGATGATGPIGGLDAQVVFNDGGAAAGSSGLTYNKITQALTGTYVISTTGFSGSLTRLTDGTSYLVEGNNIGIVSGANGSVTISNTAPRFYQWNELSPSPILNTTASVAIVGALGASYNPLTIGSDVFFFVSGSITGSGANSKKSVFGGDVSVSGSLEMFGDVLEVSGTIVATEGISGSLTKLSDGTSYLVAGNNIGISSGSNGSVTISTIATVNPDFFFSTTAGSIYTTGSAAFIGNQVGIDSPFDVGASVNFYVSGTRSSAGTDDPSIVFRGDTFISGAFGVTDYIQLKPVGNLKIPTNTSASYIYTSGSTNDLYYTQYQPGTGFTNTIRMRWLEGALATGLLHGGVLSTANGSTSFSITSGSGLVVDFNASTTADPYPAVHFVSWPAYVSSSLTYSGSAQITYIGINSSGGIIQQFTPFANNDFADIISIGRVLHQSGSVTNGTITSPAVAYGLNQSNEQFTRAFGPLKVSGHTLGNSGSNLSLSKTSGTAYVAGRNYTANPDSPNLVLPITDVAPAASKIFREYVSGSTPVIDSGIANAGYPVIDPALYNNNGILASVAGGQYTIQRVYWFPNSVNKAFFVYYGSATYATLDIAEAAINAEAFTEGANTLDAGIYLGAVIVRGNATDLSNTSQARFVRGGLFRGADSSGGGGGGSIATVPGGLDTYVQFNDGGSTFGGDPGLTFDKINHILQIGDGATSAKIITAGANFDLVNTAATTVNFAGAATSINIGTAPGTNIISGTIKAPQGLSGSLTKLTDGTSYLVAGGNMAVITGSNGAITLSTVNSGTIHNVIAGNGLAGGGNSGTISLSINNSIVATVSGTTFTGATKHTAGISGSLTQLVDGSSYLIAGTNITIVTGSNGSVNISAPSTVTGIGTTGYVPVFTGAGSIGNSSTIYNAGGAVGIGTTVLNGNALSILGTTALTGSFLPGLALTYDLGSAAASWRDVYARTGSFLGDLNVSGDLRVLGTSSIINSEIVNIKDNAILLNAGPSPLNFGGVYVADTTASTTGSLIWDTVTDRWKAGFVGNEINVVTTGSTDNLYNKTLPISGQNTSTISGGTQGGVGYFNTSTNLSSSAAGTPGQLLQSAGTAAPTWVNFGSLVSGSNVITGSGTANYHAKFTSGNAIANSLVYDDGTSVGVNNTTPSATLHVGNNDSATLLMNGASKLLFRDSGTYIQELGGLKIESGIGRAIVFNTANTEKMRLDTLGNLLLGTTSNPNGYRQVVNGDASLYTSNDTAGVTVLRLGSSVSMPQGIATVTGTKVAVGGGYLSMQTATGGTLVEHLRILSGGDVGIGTTSPQNKLQVYGDLRVGLTTPGAFITLGDEGTSTKNNGIYRPAASNTVSIGAYSFATINVSNTTLGNQTERMRVDSSGNVGIGTNTYGSRLYVSGSTSATTPTATIKEGVIASSSAIGILDVQNYTGSSLLFVSGSGFVGVGTNTPSSPLVPVAGGKFQVSSSNTGDAAFGLFIGSQFLGASLNYYDAYNHIFRHSDGSTIKVLLDGNGNVGIGSMSSIGLGSPLARLLVSGSSASATAGLVVKSGIASPEGAVFEAQGNDGTSLLVVSGSGRVGIGTSSPVGLLNLRGYTGGTVGSAVAAFNKTLVLGGAFNQPYNTGNSVLLHILDYSNDAGDNVYPIYVEDENNNVAFFINGGTQGNAGYAYFGTTVGIGTTALDVKLAVNGNSVFSGSVSPDGDLTRDLGSSTKRWKNFYAGNIIGSLTGSNLTAGQVVVAGTGGLLSGSNNFWRDNANGNVGIGTSSPGYALDIFNGSLKLNKGNYIIVGNDSNDSIIAQDNPAGFPSTPNVITHNTYHGAWGFRDSNTGTYRLTILANNGNVGIGTTNPQARLHVTGSSTTTDTTFLVREGVAAASSAYILNTQNLAGTNILMVSGSGKVGIGAAPTLASPLYVFGNVAGPQVTVGASSGVAPNGISGYNLRIDTTDLWQLITDNNAGNSFFLQYNSTPLGRYLGVTTTGMVGIGTTNPGYNLQVGSGASVGTRTIAAIDSGYGILLAGGNDVSKIQSIGVAYPLEFQAGNGNNGNYRFTSTGNVGISTAIPTSKLHIYTTQSDAAATPSVDINAAFFRLGDATTGLTFNNGVGFKLHDNNTHHYSIGQLSGSFCISQTSDNGNVLFSSGRIDGIVMNPSGFVGLGTTLMDSRLVVNGTAVFSGSANPDADLTRDLGSASKRWNSIYAGNIIGAVTASNLTAGQVVVAGTGGVLSGSNNFFWNDSSRSIGIGTSSPAALLEVSSSLAGNRNANLRIGIDFLGLISVNTYKANTQLWYHADGTQRMAIDGNGDVGIGTHTINTARLHVSGSVASQATFIAQAPAEQTGGVAVLEVNKSSGATLLFVSGSGNVGIGTRTPTDKLSIHSGAQDRVGFGVSSAVSTIYLGSTTSTEAYRTLEFDRASGKLYFKYGTVGASLSTSTTIDSLGNVGIGTTSPGFNLEVNGTFAATTKSFVIPHPTRVGWKLRYGSLEGPENGIYIRGECNTEVIELPDYWRLLVDESSITVQLTSIGKYQTLFVESIENNSVKIGRGWLMKLFGIKPRFFYTVTANRKDVKFEPEYVA